MVRRNGVGRLEPAQALIDPEAFACSVSDNRRGTKTRHVGADCDIRPPADLPARISTCSPWLVSRSSNRDAGVGLARRSTLHPRRARIQCQGLADGHDVDVEHQLHLRELLEFGSRWADEALTRGNMSSWAHARTPTPTHSYRSEQIKQGHVPTSCGIPALALPCARPDSATHRQATCLRRRQNGSSVCQRWDFGRCTRMPD